jgi:hypothetical protein
MNLRGNRGIGASFSFLKRVTSGKPGRPSSFVNWINSRGRYGKPRTPSKKR